MSTHNSLLKTVHGLEVFKRNHCDFMFWKKTSYQQHIREHLRFPKIFSCEECEDKFSSGVSLGIHMDIHKVKVQTKFECEKCMQVFSLKKNYTRHVENSLKDGIDKYTYNVFLKALCTKTSLVKHLESEHEGSGEFNCHKCIIRYEAKSKLKNHVVNVQPHFQRPFKHHILLMPG